MLLSDQSGRVGLRSNARTRVAAGGPGEWVRLTQPTETNLRLSRRLRSLLGGKATPGGSRPLDPPSWLDRLAPPAVSDLNLGAAGILARPSCAHPLWRRNPRTQGGGNAAFVSPTVIRPNICGQARQWV